MDLNMDFTLSEEELAERIAQIKEEANSLILSDEIIDALCASMPTWVNDPDKVDWKNFADEPTPLELAINIAVLSHMGQVDKNGRPYILHVLRVMMCGKNDAEKMVGVLHDVIEDTETTARELLEEGIPVSVVMAVLAITHDEDKHEPRKKYYERIKANELALAVKRYDLDDNSSPERMAQLDENTQARLMRKYREAYLELYGEVPEHLYERV